MDGNVGCAWGRASSDTAKAGFSWKRRLEYQGLGAGKVQFRDKVKD
jgi:hypothetical protein